MTIERRVFLKGVALTCGAAVCPSLSGCIDEGPTVALPAVSGGRITVTIDAADPAVGPLAMMDGWVRGAAPGFADPILLVRTGVTTIAATNAICTHKRCKLQFNLLNYTAKCPCHDSEFELDGQVVIGPAERPIAVYTTEFDGTTLVILLS